MHMQKMRLRLIVALSAGLGLAACGGASSSQVDTAGSEGTPSGLAVAAPVAAPSAAPAATADVLPSGDAGEGETTAVGVVVTEAAQSKAPASKATMTAPFPMLVVTKSPTCGCCHLWVEHMQKAGFRVEVHDVENINLVKERVGVPFGKGSCHTAEVGGYFVEGHVPAEDVKRLLAEKPNAKGLAVPGMPAGSPGMELPDGRGQPYVVELVAHDGSTSPFAHHGQ